MTPVDDQAPATAPPRQLEDPELSAFLARRIGLDPLHRMGVEAARAAAAALRPAGGQPHEPCPVVVEDIAVQTGAGAVPVRVYRPVAQDLVGVVTYLHGGGWVVGGIEQSDELCRLLATTAGCTVVSVGYRLAPEHPFPAALDDADAVLSWVDDVWAPGHPQVVMGDSAGGNLAAVVARRRRDRGDRPLVLQVLVYPVTDARMESGSYRTHASPLLIGADDMRWFWDQYVPDTADRCSADASPLHATDLSGLPPAVVVVAELDPLRDEVLSYAERLAVSGVEVTVQRYEAMAHGFFALVGALSVARTAVASVAAQIRARLS